jgi:hypothetical protein
MSAIAQSISIIYHQPKFLGTGHFAFRNRDISPAFASSLIDLEVFPDRNLAIWVINGVGTTR